MPLAHTSLSASLHQEKSRSCPPTLPVNAILWYFRMPPVISVSGLLLGVEMVNIMLANIRTVRVGSSLNRVMCFNRGTALPVTLVARRRKGSTAGP
jgi:hypothetical protein